MRCVVTVDHEIPVREPLKVSPGDSVQVGDREAEWPAFVFVTARWGAGWIPARHIDIDGASGTVRVAYDTTELSTSRGEMVDVIRDDPDSGWSWCRNADGGEGWVPHRALAAV